MKNAISLFLCLIFFLIYLTYKAETNRTYPDVASRQRAVLEVHVRLVWIQDQGNNKDVFAQGQRLQLMAFDSHDGRGERVLGGELGSYVRPLFCTEAREIVFTSYDVNGKAYVWRIDWEGKSQKKITSGRALDVWKGSDIEWVYVQKDPQVGQNDDQGDLYRYPLHGTGSGELLFHGHDIALSRDSFRISRDGSVASGLFPWPKAGIYDIHHRRVTIFARGCWTSLAPDNSRILWVFQPDHRNIHLIDTQKQQQWEVALNTADYINGHEVYHPRWSNNRKYIAITRRYTIFRGGNAIRGGGAEVEILIGRFSENLNVIERWWRITRNQKADFYPDLWINPESLR